VKRPLDSPWRKWINVIRLAKILAPDCTPSVVHKCAIKDAKVRHRFAEYFATLYWRSATIRRKTLDTVQQKGRTMSNPHTEVLTPLNSQLIFIDQQPQMAFGVQSIDRQTLKSNTVGLAKAAKIFNVPTTFTTVETESFSGHTYPELLAVFPDAPLLERTSMNSWDDQKVRDALKKNARNKIIVSGLWTEVCNTTFALSAMHDAGYEIYMVADASGGTTKEAHDYAMQRMIQAGVVPVTWQQVLLEWQRDWKNRDTYDAVMELVKEHSGAYGMGVDYAYTMVHKSPERVQHGPTLAPVAASV
jgi:nicotinamidase-related amidase